jgi:signal transduction histidine kinase/ActR/RegA family two-component response regulator
MFLSWQLTPLALPQALAAVVSFVSFGLVWRRRHESAAARDMGIMLLCAGWWALCGTLEFGATSLEAKILLSQLSYFGILGAPWALFRFALSYTDSDTAIPRWVEPLLGAVAGVVLLGVFTNGWHGWIWLQVDLIHRYGYIFAWYEHGPLFWLNILYCYGLMLSSCMLLLRYAIFSEGLYRFQSLLTIVAVICPWAMSIAYLFRLGPTPELDNTPVGFALGSILMSWNVLRWRLLDVSPVAAHTLFANMTDPVLVSDAKGRLVNANTVARNRFSLEQSAMGAPLQKVFRQQAELARFFTLQTTPSMTLKLGDVWWNVEITELTDRGSFLRGRLYVFRDTTEYKLVELDLRRAKRELEAAREEAVAAGEAKSRFLASISHEIRTPLNAVAGYAQLLNQRTDLPSSVHGSLAAINEASDHLLHLIEGILDLSKIEAGKMDVQPTDFDLEALLKSVRVIFEQRCQEKGLTCEVVSDSATPRWVKGDEGKVRQVLVNLVGNAVKFTDTGGVIVSVKAEEGDQYRFEIRDTGSGLATDSLTRIFHPFEQAQETRINGGTGLGLPISHRLVEMMGGHLAVESALGSGSTFSFTLPLTRTVGSVAFSGQAAAVRLADDCEVRALVVDDVKVNRDLLRHMLRGMKCTVTEAESGEGALTAYHQKGADIVFLDINMEGERAGLQVARVLAAVPENRPRLVCYSAAAFQHEWEEFLQAGFDDFLPKPIRVERVRQCIERVPGVRFAEVLPQASVSS